ncbi:MAG: TetR/AcrR family transcriptional regulator [Bacteroidales bacterium]|nr:TetR/AcrR family transcriptional regulator [Lachnoclostridium sp.]MCM1383424.1 TetR/AcrR family transcriptional regulator [Lachnoclostridium sp.]MCM1464273.1 TetR/AcrR family transcriptional regulator [Bacteroidales bacterium]
MGKAFSDEEKQEIRKKLLETGTEMFHDNSVKAINIRELTARAGISQGGFYTFYKDKDAFVLDVMRYRSAQKIADAERLFLQPTEDPAGLMSRVLFDYLIDMKHKTDTREAYSEVFKMLVKQQEKLGARSITLFRGFMEKVAAYWRKQMVPVEVDMEGMCGVMAGAFVLFVHNEMIDRDYFDEIFKAFLDAGVRKYIWKREDKQ